MHGKGNAAAPILSHTHTFLPKIPSSYAVHDAMGKFSLGVKQSVGIKYWALTLSDIIILPHLNLGISILYVSQSGYALGVEAATDEGKFPELG